MKKLFLGRSEAGKTTIAQLLKGEKPAYKKTQYTYAGEDVIDTPGEYSESKEIGVGLACFSFESDVVAIVAAADEPFCLFEPNCNAFLNRPLIGIVTKIDSPCANVPMVAQWLRNCCCERIFYLNNMTGEGLDSLKEYLDGDVKRLSLEEAKERQRRGLAEWQDDVPRVQ